MSRPMQPSRKANKELNSVLDALKLIQYKAMQVDKSSNLYDRSQQVGVRARDAIADIAALDDYIAGLVFDVELGEISVSEAYTRLDKQLAVIHDKYPPSNTDPVGLVVARKLPQSANDFRGIFHENDKETSLSEALNISRRRTRVTGLRRGKGVRSYAYGAFKPSKEATVSYDETNHQRPWRLMVNGKEESFDSLQALKLSMLMVNMVGYDTGWKPTTPRDY